MQFYFKLITIFFPFIPLHPGKHSGPTETGYFLLTDGTPMELTTLQFLEITE